jgi:hypothetical protein
MQADIIIPLLAGAALLLWIGRGLSWTQKLAAAAVTLAIVMAILFFERGASSP